MNASVGRTALLAVLVTTAGSRDSFAQRFQCYPIRPGDTAAHLAQRLTGDALNRRASWFQIVDRRWQLVSKVDYDVIYPGWHACVPELRPRAASTQSFGGPIVSAGLQKREPPAANIRSASDDGFVWWFASLVFLATLATWLFAVSYWKKRQAIAQAMRRFGGDFIGEFGRPLTQYRGASPLPRTRLRMVPRRARVEILVAPSAGQTYPNLSDHRSNVEYDVARVMGVLGNESFASSPPYSEGQWVVLPFQFKDSAKQEGFQ